MTNHDDDYTERNKLGPAAVAGDQSSFVLHNHPLTIGASTVATTTATTVQAAGVVTARTTTIQAMG